MARRTVASCLLLVVLVVAGCGGGGSSSGATSSEALPASSRLLVVVDEDIATAIDDGLAAYTASICAYRESGSLVPRTAFVFKDEDWRTYRAGMDWWLGGCYGTVTRYEAAETTTRQSYQDFMTTVGAEFVYQWIHSAPATLYVENGGSYETLTAAQIEQSDLRGSFFNLFDCSATRFTETNLGAAYLKTSYGLAVVGSAKTGGMYDPYLFHSPLAAGRTWGQAFASWYDGVGALDDSWYLGMSLQGCPMVKLVGATKAALTAALQPEPPTLDELAELDALAYRTAMTTQVGTYADYVAAHPRFAR